MRHQIAILLLAFGSSIPLSSQDIPRTASGRPDLSGTYDTATLTPLERPEIFGDRLTLSEEEAATIAQGETSAFAAVFGIPEERNIESAPPSAAPPVGGDGSIGAAGAVGGYNTFWMDRGNSAFQIDGQWRTSIITEPANGRRPEMTPESRDSLKTVSMHQDRTMTQKYVPWQNDAFSALARLQDRRCSQFSITI